MPLLLSPRNICLTTQLISPFSKYLKELFVLCKADNSLSSMVPAYLYSWILGSWKIVNICRTSNCMNKYLWLSLPVWKTWDRFSILGLFLSNCLCNVNTVYVFSSLKKIPAYKKISISLSQDLISLSSWRWP